MEYTFKFTASQVAAFQRVLDISLKSDKGGLEIARLVVALNDLLVAGVKMQQEQQGKTNEVNPNPA